MRSLLMKCTPAKRQREQLSRTCRPAFALCDFGALPAASLLPAFPPVDLPFPPAISIWTGEGLEWKTVADDYVYARVIILLQKRNDDVVEEISFFQNKCRE